MTKAKTITLTQAEVRARYYYEPDTGKLISLSPRSDYHGKEVGYVWEGPSGKRYRRVETQHKIYFCHRLIWFWMTGEQPDEIDHQDGNGLNNKWENLSASTHVLNVRNQKKYKTNTSGHAGVFWSRARNKWRAQIYENGGRTYLGSYAAFSDAVAARKEAERRLAYHPNHGTERAI